jgi:hypothetical protein
MSVRLVPGILTCCHWWRSRARAERRLGLACDAFVGPVVSASACVRSRFGFRSPWAAYCRIRTARIDRISCVRLCSGRRSHASSKTAFRSASVSGSRDIVLSQSRPRFLRYASDHVSSASRSNAAGILKSQQFRCGISRSRLSFAQYRGGMCSVQITKQECLHRDRAT